MYFSVGSLQKIFTLGFILFTLSLRAQDKCIATKPLDPVVFDDWLSSKVQRPSFARLSAEPYRIPVIVHVVHDQSELIGVGANISFDQIFSQFTVLNNDLNRLNADTIHTPPEFESVAGRLNIEFIPALVDPSGNMLEEPGINRINRNVAGFDPPPYSFDYLNSTIKLQTIWDPHQYMNIWVCDFSDALGAAQFPDTSLPGSPVSTNGDTDGIVINYLNFGAEGNVQPGYDGGRTLTHEVGHWFGLHHIWGLHDPDVADCNDDDFVTDTPNQDQANGLCPLNQGPSCPGVAREMWENYMDYTFDECMNIFTIGQVDRMEIVIKNSPRRLELLTSAVGDKFDQIIVFDELGSQIFGEMNEIPLEGSADSGLPLTYISSDPTVASIANGTLFIHMAGEVTITATQDGDYFYFPALSVSRTLLIIQVTTDLIVGEIGEKFFGDPSFEVDITSNSNVPLNITSSDPLTLSITGFTATILNVGVVEITVSQIETVSYTGVDTTLTLEIKKGFQEIIKTLIDSLKDADQSVVLFESSSGLPLTYEIVSKAIQQGTGNELIINQPGFVSLSVHQPGSEQYNSAVSVDSTFCIWPIPLISKSDATVINPNTLLPIYITLSSNYPDISQWFHENELINDFPSIRATKFGEYKLEVGNDGCIISKTYQIDVNIITSLSDEKLSSNPILFPNPAKDIIYIEGIIGNSNEYTIFDQLGRGVLHGTLDKHFAEIIISDLKNGTYIIVLQNSDNTSARKFFKE